MDLHYVFPPARAYPLNRCLFLLKSDDAFRPRYLADGVLELAGGQSGHFLSPHFRDFHRDWLEGRPTPFLAALTAGLAVELSANTQPVPEFGSATARAAMGTGSLPNNDESSRCCGWLTTTSTACGART